MVSAAGVVEATPAVVATVVGKAKVATAADIPKVVEVAGIAVAVVSCLEQRYELTRN